MLGDYDAHGVTQDGERFHHRTRARRVTITESYGLNDIHEGDPIELGGTRDFGIYHKDYIKYYDWNRIDSIQIER